LFSFIYTPKCILQVNTLQYEKQKYNSQVTRTQHIMPRQHYLQNKTIQDGSQHNLMQPHILIATGTGIAPIRSFLLHRKTMLQQQKYPLSACWVFYGCRTKSEYLYSQELESMMESGIITKLIPAYSREGPKVYVQNKIAEHGESLISLMILNQGCIHICGLSAMVKPLQTTWTKLLMEHSNFSEDLASKTLEDWKSAHRYIIDVWN